LLLLDVQIIVPDVMPKTQRMRRSSQTCFFMLIS